MLSEMQLPHPGFELGAMRPFPMTLTITPRSSITALYICIDYVEMRGVMVKVMGNGLVAPSSNPGCGNCISLSANTLGKGMNTTLPPAMGKQ